MQAIDLWPSLGNSHPACTVRIPFIRNGPITLKDQVIDAAMLGEYFPKTGPLADILGIGIIGLVFQSCLGNDQF